MWALQLFRWIVSQSLNNVDDGAESVLKKCSKPFSFEENKGNSEFEIVQILRDEEYQYGFEYNSEKIVMEWLYRKSLKTNRKVTIFERTMQKVNLGVSVRKECEAYKDQIPPETLLLSFFNKLKLKTDIFKTVYSGITDVLVFMSDDYEDTRFLDALLPKVIDGKKEKLLEFLTAIDIGIKDITYKEKETSVYKGYKQDKIEMRGDRAEMSDFPLYLNTVAGGLDRRDQAIGGFSFAVVRQRLVYFTYRSMSLMHIES